jgi:hypothetical protein
MGSIRVHPSPSIHSSPWEYIRVHLSPWVHPSPSESMEPIQVHPGPFKPSQVLPSQFKSIQPYRIHLDPYNPDSHCSVLNLTPAFQARHPLPPRQARGAWPWDSKGAVRGDLRAVLNRSGHFRFKFVAPPHQILYFATCPLLPYGVHVPANFPLFVCMCLFTSLQVLTERDHPHPARAAAPSGAAARNTFGDTRD